ncbi:hypothetical protein [Mangrovibacterium sp.]|uniref:hypothetical protein n=1 Tax=Mangrovibacterium sp. TaxID=1961364 RepID=UPI003563188F
MREVKLTLPSGWDQLNENQLLGLSRLFLRCKSEKELLVKSFLLLTGLRMKKGIAVDDGQLVFTFRNRKVKPFELNAQTFAPMLENLSWIRKEFSPLRVLPSLLRFKGCNAKLYNVSLEDYLRMDTNFRAFGFTAKQKYLNKLLSIVFSANRFWFVVVPMYRKQAVLLWFAGIKTMLKQNYPYLWPSGGEGGQAVTDQEIVFSLLSSLNNGDVTKNKEILKTHVHEAFYQLNLKAQQTKTK